MSTYSAILVPPIYFLIFYFLCYYGCPTFPSTPPQPGPSSTFIVPSLLSIKSFFGLSLGVALDLEMIVSYAPSLGMFLVSMRWFNTEQNIYFVLGEI